MGWKGAAGELLQPPCPRESPLGGFLQTSAWELHLAVSSWSLEGAQEAALLLHPQGTAQPASPSLQRQAQGFTRLNWGQTNFLQTEKSNSKRWGQAGTSAPCPPPCPNTHRPSASPLTAANKAWRGQGLTLLPSAQEEPVGKPGGDEWIGGARLAPTSCSTHRCPGGDMAPRRGHSPWPQVGARQWEMISPTPGTEGGVQGVCWEGFTRWEGGWVPARAGWQQGESFSPAQGEGTVLPRARACLFPRDTEDFPFAETKNPL